MTLTTFRGRFPEFKACPDVQVQDAIDQATVETGSVFGKNQDKALGLMAAHTLAMSPFGQQARLSAADGNTTYMKQWRRLRTLATCGVARVAGVGGGMPPGIWRR